MEREVMSGIDFTDRYILKLEVWAKCYASVPKYQANSLNFARLDWFISTMNCYFEKCLQTSQSLTEKCIHKKMYSKKNF